ncbi:MAG: glycoside hydrolase family 2 [Solobacterium sp.]|nr:glycoside hydrolase family 2 [Solobacterium sp.]
MTLLSPWGETLDPKNIKTEYPRMQLQRDSFFCLNGEWEFQITDGSQPDRNTGWERILVPFALGSKLSGTDKTLKPNETLWYRKKFNYYLTKNRVILNFEAVDQCCTVYLNGLLVGGHEGGYAPFEIDISNAIKQENELIVRVTDQSDQGNYAYGKQKMEHGGMWYTPSAGIWQTVWIEELKPASVMDIKITPDLDTKKVYVHMTGGFTQAVLSVFENRKLVHRGITVEKEYVIPLDEVHEWSPEDPFLYDLYVETEEETIKSYFGMRKVSIHTSYDGHARFLLNNRPYFLSGLLDQGYSVDGLLTYPSEEAMEYEIQTIKEMGFNCLRKHVKQEARRWYYLCDKYGILVMQDMPNGGGPYAFPFVAVKPNLGFKKAKDSDYEKFGRSNAEGREIYYRELDQMLDTLYNNPCIFAWVPFNEGWGQFDSAEVTKHIKNYDTTRLVDSASGWYDQGAGDFNSQHVYFTPFKVKKEDHRPLLLSEFGGYAYLEWGHSEAEKLYGYKKYTDKIELNDAIFRAYEQQILPAIEKGLCGCIYTQVSDVEDECNGLFTADRRILKIDAKKMKKINAKCIGSLK